MTSDRIGDIVVVLSCALLAGVALLDVAYRVIPNGACLAVLLLATLLRLMAGDLLPSLLVAACVFLLATACWLRGWLGGGDVKLLGAVVLLVPPGEVAAQLGDVAVAGGALALGYLALSRIVAVPHGHRPAATLPRIVRAERWRVSRRRSVPYACAIATGTLIALLNG